MLNRGRSFRDKPRLQLPRHLLHMTAEQEADEAPSFVITVKQEEEEDALSSASNELQQADANIEGQESAWQQTTRALGLGPVSFAMLGLSVLIITCNAVLGPGWVGRLSDGAPRRGETAQMAPYQELLLNGPENLI
ncbi:unnamed protein product [Chrysoparadoxa australica]